MNKFPEAALLTEDDANPYYPPLPPATPLHPSLPPSVPPVQRRARGRIADQHDATLPSTYADMLFIDLKSNINMDTNQNVTQS